MTKICTKCGKYKDLSCFSKRKKSKDGLAYWCKDCDKKYHQQKHPENVINNRKVKEGYKICIHCKEEKPYSSFVKNNTYLDGYSGSCKDCDKLYRKKNEEKIKLNREKWLKNNSDYHETYRKINREKINKRFKESYNKSVTFRLNNCFSRNLHRSLNYFNSFHWETLVPYTLKELKLHLESQFTPEMSWDNYGSYWEIDHIIPQNTFNFTSYNDKDFQICWSLLNLRPLELHTNRSRPKDGSDIPEELKQQILNQVNITRGEE